MEINSTNLKFHYGKTEVLCGLSFSVTEREITFLAGENGSGKTTWILNAVSLLKPCEGSILYDGKAFEDIRPAVSVAFDTTPFYPFLSVKDNLKALYDVDASDPDNLKFLHDMGLDDFLISRKVSKLSYGQKHRVGIGGALMRNVECYILDEPDLGLDPKAWKAVCEKIISLKNNGKSVLITGQNYPMLQELVNRIVVLKNGQALYEGNLADFIEKYDPDNGSMRKAFEKITGETGEAL